MIVGVDLNGVVPSHYVIVTGRQGNQYQIVDPGHRSVTSLDPNDGFSIRGQVIDPPSDVSALNLSVGDAELLIIDPTGNRMGFDSASGIIHEEIPRSTHFIDSLKDDLTGEAATEVSYSVPMFQPLQGTYQVSVIGLKLGTYTLLINSFSQDGSPQPALAVSGMTRPGLTSTYLIAYSSTPGAVARVFDTFLQDDSNGITFNFSSTSGDYQFTRCSDGFTLNGRGQVIKRGCGIFLQDFSSSDRRVVAQIDNCQNKGTATVQVFALGRTFTILDRNTGNNTGTCR